MPWFRGVTVSTLDSESSDPSSNLGGTLDFMLLLRETVMQSDYGIVNSVVNPSAICGRVLGQSI